MVIVVIWLLVGLVIGLYILFVVWRVRVERRKKELRTRDVESTLSNTLARAAMFAPPVIDPPPAPAAPAQPTQPMPAMQPMPAAARAEPSSSPAATTVAEALAGISLPSDLAPLTTMAPRGGIADRVAFWTVVPAEVTGPAFGDELERLGYTITALDQHTLAAQRGDNRLIAIIHPDGQRATIGEQQAFESVPELSTVIEIWIPL